MDKHFLDDDIWELVERISVIDGQAAAEFTGLDGDVDHTYRLIINNENRGVAAGYLTVQFNNDTGANYEYLSSTCSGGASPHWGAYQLNLGDSDFGTVINGLRMSSAMSGQEQCLMDFMIAGRAGLTGGHIVSGKAYTNGSSAGDYHPRAGRWNNAAAITSIQVLINNQLPAAWTETVTLDLYRLRQ